MYAYLIEFIIFFKPPNKPFSTPNYVAFNHGGQEEGGQSPPSIQHCAHPVRGQFELFINVSIHVSICILSHFFRSFHMSPLLTYHYHQINHNIIYEFSYDIKLTPDLQAFTFVGQCKIYLSTVANLGLDHREIVLHAKELCFASASYTVVQQDGQQSRPNDAEEIRVNTKATTATFVFGESAAIPPGATILLSVHYSGFLNNQMAGFYRSSYTDIHGESKIMASTQFESLDARRAFPCWDEPSRKAVFGVTLVIPVGLDCFSNMPEAGRSTLPGGKSKEVSFLESPVMSTYLLAFVVGEFDHLQTITEHGVLIRVYTPPGKSEAGRYALDCASKSLDLFDDFFGVPYPLPKLDMVAIPEFAAGAMENWGLVTYREVEVLIDPVRASNSQKQRVTTVITHELAHQWFGNLVTMSWWDDLWLNEGFASWAENWVSRTATLTENQHICLKMERLYKYVGTCYVTGICAQLMYKSLLGVLQWFQYFLRILYSFLPRRMFGQAADKIHPDMKMWDQFTTGHLSAALRLDALRSSHPIQVPIGHAEEVEEVFDAISYCKGGSVVRMIRAIIGFNAFQTGLGAYMKKHAYGNTETYDLWKAWEDASDLPVQDMMASWTEQTGFPLVSVVGEMWGEEEATFELEQTWFLSDGSELSDKDKKKKWTIPILTCTGDGAQADMVFMREKTVTISVPLLQKGGWVKLNAGQEVPMRVLCTPTMLARLGEGIKSKSLSPCDRAGLLTDAYALVKAGRMQPETLIKLLANYVAEDEYIVWQGIAGILVGLDTLTSDDADMNANLKAFAKAIVLNLAKNVGWEAKGTDGHLTVLLRSSMIGLLGSFCYDDADVALEAKTRFAAFRADYNDVQSLPSDIRSSVFEIYLKNGGEKEYNEVLAYYEATTDNAERKHVLASLGNAPERKLKIRTMEWTTSGAVKLQDFFYAMGSVGRSSRDGRDVAWVFFKDNFEKIKGMIAGAGPSLMDACFVSCAGGFCSHEKADEIEAFFKKNPLPKNARKINQTLEAMRTNANFLDALKASDLAKDEFWAAIELDVA